MNTIKMTNKNGYNNLTAKDVIKTRDGVSILGTDGDYITVSKDVIDLILKAIK
tara:strand:- start:897 stop:1055 length:159 start_codon:yes stop_codon:yes gene_type:complete